MKKRMLKVLTLVVIASSANLSFSQEEEKSEKKIKKHEVGLGVEEASHYFGYTNLHLKYSKLLKNFNLSGSVNIGFPQDWYHNDLTYFGNYYSYYYPEPLTPLSQNNEFIGNNHVQIVSHSLSRIKLGMERDLKLAKYLNLRISSNFVAGIHHVKNSIDISNYVLKSTYSNLDPFYPSSLDYYGEPIEILNTRYKENSFLILGGEFVLNFMFKITDDMSFSTGLSYQIAKHVKQIKENTTYSNESHVDLFKTSIYSEEKYENLNGLAFEIGLNYRF